MHTALTRRGLVNKARHKSHMCERANVSGADTCTAHTLGTPTGQSFKLILKLLLEVASVFFSLLCFFYHHFSHGCCGHLFLFFKENPSFSS